MKLTTQHIRFTPQQGMVARPTCTAMFGCS
jgi:hypothetical protein